MSSTTFTVYLGFCCVFTLAITVVCTGLKYHDMREQNDSDLQLLPFSYKGFTVFLKTSGNYSWGDSGLLHIFPHAFQISRFSLIWPVIFSFNLDYTIHVKALELFSIDFSTVTHTTVSLFVLTSPLILVGCCLAACDLRITIAAVVLVATPTSAFIGHPHKSCRKDTQVNPKALQIPSSNQTVS